MRFDYYAATLPEGARMTAVDALLPLSDGRPGLVKGAFGYGRGWAMARDGVVFARVYEGPGLRDHVVVSGADSPEVAAVLRARFPDHSVSRADACVDFPGGEAFFGSARSILRDVCLGRVTLTDYAETSPTGREAATLYCGARTSETRLRLYEKWKEDPSYPEGINRLEAQVRPAKPSRKAYAASVSPEGVFGFARWSREALAAFGGVAPAAPVRSARVTDLDRSLMAMVGQYGKRLYELLDLLGGDVGAVGPYLLGLDAQLTAAPPVTRDRAREIREAG